MRLILFDAADFDIRENGSVHRSGGKCFLSFSNLIYICSTGTSALCEKLLKVPNQRNKLQMRKSSKHLE